MRSGVARRFPPASVALAGSVRSQSSRDCARVMRRLGTRHSGNTPARPESAEAGCPRVKVPVCRALACRRRDSDPRHANYDGAQTARYLTPVRAAAAIAVTAVLLAVGPAAAADDERLAALRTTPAPLLSAYDGHVVWSEQVAERRHVLMHWHRGRVVPLPAEWINPFFFDVGSDARRRPVASIPAA